MKPTIALTIGDPNGIGPEIAVKAAAKLAREGGPGIVLVGDQFVVRHYAELCAKDFVVRPFDGAPAESGCLRLLAVDSHLASVLSALESRGVIPTTQSLTRPPSGSFLKLHSLWAFVT